MKLEAKMMYLGSEDKISNKTQKPYKIAKLFDVQTTQVFQFFIMEDNPLFKAIGLIVPMSECGVILSITSYQGEPRVNLERVEN